MLGEKIKIVRKSMRFTQVEFASMLKVSKQTVSNWENDEAIPSVELLKSIAEKCSVTTDFLLDLDQRHVIDVDQMPIEIVSHIQQVINDIKKIISDGGVKNDKNSYM